MNVVLRCKNLFTKTDGQRVTYHCKELQDEATIMRKCAIIQKVYRKFEPNGNALLSGECVWFKSEDIKECPFFEAP